METMYKITLTQISFIPALFVNYGLIWNVISVCLLALMGKTG
jgi:hypothetical protein